MEITRNPLFSCDICHKQSEWKKGVWIARIYMINTKDFEHEFHLCSDICDDKLKVMTKKERMALALIRKIKF